MLFAFEMLVAVAFYYYSFVVVNANWSDPDIDTDSIRFDPIGLGRNRSVYLVKAGEKFIVSCLVYNPSTTDTHSVQWVNEASTQIEYSISVFTQAKHELDGTTKRSLIFPRIQQRDSGDYACRVELRPGEGFIAKMIHVIVRNNLEWKTRGERVGGVLNGPLTIDCGADGEPKPAIEISDEAGHAISDAIFKVSGSEATIPSLSKEHQDLRVRCIAMQKLHVKTEFNTTVSDVHDLTVDVWFPPEFEFPEVEHYAIQGQTVSLPCIVTASNPPVEKFTFSNGDNIVVFNHERSTVTQQLDSQMAILQIDHVEEEDFGRYKCEVFNGKLRSAQTIVLKRTRPPKQPKVVIEKITNTSVTWRVKEEREYGELPILSYSIVYGPNRGMAKQNPKNAPRSIGSNSTATDSKGKESLNGKTIRNGKIRIVRQRIATGLYQINGLEPDLEYEFLFYAKSEAGTGDPTMVKTVISPEGVAIMQSSAWTPFVPIWVSLLGLIAFIFLFV